ncbi:MAG TPA: kelch repeat-containing protein [Polyangiaceae bacterium]|jgi:hypothetical protein
MTYVRAFVASCALLGLAGAGCSGSALGDTDGGSDGGEGSDANPGGGGDATVPADAATESGGNAGTDSAPPPNDAGAASDGGGSDAGASDGGATGEDGGAGEDGGVADASSQDAADSAATLTGDWYFISSGSGSPDPRNGASMIGVGDTLTLFGGYSGSAALSDTWTWHAGTWALAHPTTSPSGLYPAFAALGTSGVEFSDATWLWNGTQWSKPALSGQPPAVTGTGPYVLSALPNALLLYGGNPAQTWIWNGATWSPQSPSAQPPQRQGMASASLESGVVLFGGASFEDGAAQLLNDTWTWNGATWIPATPGNSPSPRTSPAMASLGDVVLLFGGYDISNHYLSDTWMFDGAEWTQVATAHEPPPRNSAAAATLGDSVYMFGGGNGGSSGFLQDLWQFRRGAGGGPPSDAGTSDAGATDGGLPLDAAAGDAGADGGTIDAGPACDPAEPIWQTLHVYGELSTLGFGPTTWVVSDNAAGFSQTFDLTQVGGMSYAVDIPPPACDPHLYARQIVLTATNKGASATCAWIYNGSQTWDSTVEPGGSGTNIPCYF